LVPVVELVLEPMLSEDENLVICDYYFVDHDTRCLFWLELFNVLQLGNGLEGGKIANAFNSGCLACSDSNSIVVPDIDVAFA
jgi:hypothetical protein